jgi:hypothetical protein
MKIKPGKRVTNFWICLELMLAITGCASPAVSPTVSGGVSACDASKVTVTGVHWFTDSTGAWRVVGVINNGTSIAISKVVTGVETYRKDGQPADQGEDVSAYPQNLLPGDQAPFTAWINRTIPGLDHFAVEVDECVPTDPVERGQVQARAGQMNVDSSGFAEVTAELYNTGTQPVLINGLMAAVYDRDGTLVTADYVDVATRHLEPKESGPVRATLDLPPGSAGQLTSYKLFMDAILDPTASLPLDVQNDVRVLSRYTDVAGNFHIMGTITNPGPDSLMTSLQASVYSDPARTTLVDAAEYDTWIPLQPGETLPFDLSGWGALDHTPGLWDQLSDLSAAVDLRLEPFLTWKAQANVAPLTVQGGSVVLESAQMVFSGEVVNDTGSSIDNGLVVATLRLKSSGELLASGEQRLDIPTSASEGQVWEYHITIPVPPNIDPSDVKTAIEAEGQLP